MIQFGEIPDLFHRKGRGPQRNSTSSPTEFGEESLIDFKRPLRLQTELKLLEEGYEVLSDHKFDGFGAITRSLSYGRLSERPG